MNFESDLIVATHTFICSDCGEVRKEILYSLLEVSDFKNGFCGYCRSCGRAANFVPTPSVLSKEGSRVYERKQLDDCEAKTHSSCAQAHAQTFFPFVLSHTGMTIR